MKNYSLFKILLLGAKIFFIEITCFTERSNRNNDKEYRNVFDGRHFCD